MQDKRPSDRELIKRLSEAKEFLKNRHGLFANPSKAMGELNDLYIGDANDVWLLIRELLDEISPKDYKGSRPPQKSYEKAIEGLELLAFSWWSLKCAKQMYIKFVLKDERYYYVSLHPSRSAEQHGED
ncbi:hypothetical protein [Candidatus Protochlamydia phocaeensis]|uniref:hypothetical protein n=1 Tax=Candidatus Protochlamydia phocaeensis TaxID=1414722 RepID=UPI0008391BC7|nr:hypothetical protein [Candidatus Protochlamydia phocaeensis]